MGDDYVDIRLHAVTTSKLLSTDYHSTLVDLFGDDVYRGMSSDGYSTTLFFNAELFFGDPKFSLMVENFLENAIEDPTYRLRETAKPISDSPSLEERIALLENQSQSYG